MTNDFVLSTFLSSAMQAEVVAESNSPSWTDVASFGISVLGLIGAGIAFAVGLRQYLRSEQWKRAEFLAAEMKEFFQDSNVTVALGMIDWSQREFEFPNVGRILVTRKMQSLSLTPHDAIGKMRVVLGNTTTELAAADSDVGNFFTPAETEIRDCFDSFLDGFERLGSYLASELVTVSEMDPYIRYWIVDIAAPAENDDDAIWGCCLLHYIDAYGYVGVTQLFDAFGYDIRLDSPIYQSFEDKVSSVEVQQILRARKRKTTQTRDERQPATTAAPQAAHTPTP